MSYDLNVFTKKRPEHGHLEEFVASHPGLSLQGKLGSEGNVIVSRHTDSGLEPIVEVWGPDKANMEDLEDIVLRVTKSPRWQVQIAVPAAEKDTVSLAEAMSVHIAKRCEGAVYDPQAEAIVWPKIELTSPSPLKREEAIRVVNLDWYLPPSEAHVSMAQTFLRTTKTICPQALPVRFGTHSPLQGNMNPGEEQPFLDTLEGILRRPRAEMLELRSKAPCFGGILWIPSRRNDPRMSRASQYVHLGLNFDGRVVDSDQEWCEKTVLLFTELARNLKAFYAYAFVERGVFASRRGLGYGTESEHYPVPAGKWIGIPSVPYWLSWFGGPYRPLTERTLQGPEVSRFEEGILARLGLKPKDMDELGSSKLNLPPDLVSNMKRVVKETKFPSGLVYTHEQWEATPAKFVPEIR